ncbi:MAG: SPL family radical SAM protein [Planctomycetota bacterium]|jgi:DNA repair photolyase
MADSNALIGDIAWGYRPRRPEHFAPGRIVLTKGSLDTPRRRGMIEAICDLYPKVQVLEMLDRPHNRIDVGTPGSLESHYEGKKTLVFGEHKSSVRLSDEADNTCPNYWHFSPYGFCPYDCKYCYLAGTPGVRFSPTVKIFLNLDEVLHQIDKAARKETAPTAFYLGKLQDALALDPLSGYSRLLVPFFARHPIARQIMLTKSAEIDNLIDLDHCGRTILSWSLNPPEVTHRFEADTPTPQERIAAMRKCAAVGYPLRAVIMPIVPVPDWREVYATFLIELLSTVTLQRITLGGICSYSGARKLMEAKMGPDQPITAALGGSHGASGDGRHRYPFDQRIEIYRHLINVIREHESAPPIALCLEEQPMFEALELTSALGKCNCVL